MNLFKVPHKLHKSIFKNKILGYNGIDMYYVSIFDRFFFVLVKNIIIIKYV